jgi:hypothetical protein
MAKYVVQQKRPDGNWFDVATVEGDPRERRTTIVRSSGAKSADEGATLQVRVLDEASAREYSVKVETQTKLVIS